MYIKGISERLQITRGHTCPLAFQFLRVTTRLCYGQNRKSKKCGTVYHICCQQCDKDYVLGETSRLLETRVKEHLPRNLSAVHEHCELTRHSVDSSKTKATESYTFKRRIWEAIKIRLQNPSLNKDNGFELARIYDTILAPSRSLYNFS